MMSRLLALVGLCLFVTGAASAMPRSIVDLPVPLPKPYDETADPHRDVQQALVRAKQNNKRVMIQFGGNWCGDCRILTSVLSLPDVAPQMAAAFEVVHVDVGRINKNLDIPESYGAHVKGVPTVIFLEPDGSVVNDGIVTSLSDARSLDPVVIAERILRYTR
jgi:thiol:disulfide interchange protein